MITLKGVSKKFIELDELERMYKIEEYKDLCGIVDELVRNEEISPIKSSGGNGKKPTLYKRYRVIQQKEDNSEFLEEINYMLSTKLSIDYYKNHLEKYKEHRKYILKFNDFIKNKEDLLKNRISMNERSFQIWGREKFLQKEGGKAILRNLGIDLEYLNYYDTSEPLAYYSKSKKVPQKVLIIENKDTYYTLRRHLVNGGDNIFGEEINTIIYGGGKSIIKAFKDYKISVEEYVSDGVNKILYFGDIDYEGIIIYEVLYQQFHMDYDISPFVNGYKNMIDKVSNEKISLPKTKAGQNKNIGSIFLEEFSDEYRFIMEKLLSDGLYIPQEIVNINDL